MKPMFVRYAVTVSGQRLMQHNEQLANPFSEWTQQLAKVTKKRGKTIEDHEEIARIEFQGGLYIEDPGVGPYMPGHALHKMLIEGGKRRKLGKAFASSLLVEDDRNPIVYDGPRSRKELMAWMHEFCDQRLVGIGDKRTLRTRPLFRDWSISFVVKVTNPGAINPEDIRTALEAAQSIGLGDGRPVYAGQFVLREFAEVKAAA